MKVSSQKTNVNIRHFRCVLAVHTQGSFFAAAQSLGVVPSALTETIRQIEAEVGVQIYDRSKRPPQLTSEGRRFLTEAAVAVQQFDAALDALKAPSGPRHLKIACVPSALASLVAPTIATMVENHRDLNVSIQDGIGAFVENAVLSGEADFGITARWNTERNLASSLLLRDPFCLVCHASHELAKLGRTVSLDDLERDDLIGIGPSNSIALMIAATPALPQAIRIPKLQCHSTIGQLQLVRSGVGIAFLPALAADVLQSPDLLVLPVSGHALTRDILLIHRTDSPLRDIGTEFCTRISEAVLAISKSLTIWDS